MGFLSIVLIGVGLSMDAFAVSICKGLCMRRVNWAHAFVIAFAFGLFQALMPLIGWLLGSTFAEFIEPIDHWVAFVLLVFVGGKMLWDAAHEEGCAEGDCAEGARLDLRELFVLAVATSIDALAVGVSFGMLAVNIWLAICIIGAITFAFSLVGVCVGQAFGVRFQKPAAIIGGVVLILIGVKVILEHLGIMEFWF